MATNYASASYQEILDVNTVKGNVTIIGIHTPTGNTPVRRLSGFFSQFRKFRYKGCSVQVVPAATLPADPLQVGFEAGENTIDMRDMLNPILFHGTHGESLQIAWNNIFYNHDRFNSATAAGSGYITGAGVDADDVAFADATNSPVETQYYQAITDRTWRKFGIQSTFKLPFMSPRVWKASTVYPILGNAYKDIGSMNVEPFAGAEMAMPVGSFFDSPLSQKVGTNGEVLEQHWLSSGTTPLGWLPTVTFPVNSGTVSPKPPTVLPKIFMGILVLPPSYLQELYFRVIVTHYYEFKGFTASLAPASEMPDKIGTYENAVKQTAAGSKVAESVESEDSTLESPTANIVRVSDGVF
ncbi:capsid protein [Human feces smacovirus 3]|uniref:Capsid protein n=1 Tax=Human feces smacovirus 3 TaxID=1820159 RepID=A0A221LBB9_9VIRU|nr:capsid protein [Human feces smacovirus 3]ASM90389.1 capsid protein [Human feces smacovirus 3]